MEAKKVVVLDDKIRVAVNNLLKDYQIVRAEAAKQDQAMVPGMQEAIDRCDTCIQNLTTFKEVNFPGKK